MPPDGRLPDFMVAQEYLVGLRERRVVELGGDRLKANEMLMEAATCSVIFGSMIRGVRILEMMSIDSRTSWTALKSMRLVSSR